MNSSLSVQKIEITSKERLDMRMEGITPFPFDQFYLVITENITPGQRETIVSAISVLKIGMN